jgi:branched-chain amino acid transport system substrate-binding protein
MNEIVLYAVFPTSEDLVSQSVADKAALSFAIDDMNSLFQEIGSDTRVRVNITDITSEPQSALAAVESLHTSGIHMVLGHFTSAQIEAIKPYADTQGILILSIGSSATSLSLADDNILRFNPDDSNQAEVITSLLNYYSIGDIVPLVRDDIWGNELISTIHEKMGNDTTLDDIVRYDPEVRSYEEVVSRLDTQVGIVLAQEKKEMVGVLALTFGEIVPIIEEASNEKYVNLSLVRWFGADGNTLNPDLLFSPKVATYSVARNFTGTSFSGDTSITDTSVRERLVNELGYDPNGYAYAMYDMGKIATQAISLQGLDEAKALKIAVTAIADTFSGVSGETKINEAGDRIEAHYAYWALGKDVTGDYIWKSVGDAIIWGKGSQPVLHMDGDQ